jgi:hypothetical protein
MLKQWVVGLSLSVALVGHAACFTPAQLSQMAQSETAYLSQKIPPAFKHAVQQNKVTLAVHAVDNAACQAAVEVTVPEADIAEAQALLDAQPAKKIMLNAQGYGLPTQPTQTATFTVDATDLRITHADTLQTAPLGKQRASLELMYALITQKRAELQAGQTNTQPWSAAMTQSVVEACSATQTQAVCTCVAKQYAQVMPDTQMENMQYVRNNPYALATGASQSFEQLKQQAETSCKG